MNHQLFEIKERADELLKIAQEVWNTNYNSDQIEGVEKDPIFQLIMMALAYQGEELRSEWESDKNNLLELFYSRLVPWVIDDVMPMSMILHTMPHRDIDYVKLDEEDNFKLKGHNINFMPLLRVEYKSRG